MGKNKGKKRRQAEYVALQCNIVGDAAGLGQDSMEDCLAELEGMQNPASPVQASDATSTRQVGKKRYRGEDKVNSDSLWDPSEEPVKSLSQKAWTEAFRTFVQSGSYSNGLLPSLHVEISRHFHAQKLSSFLLERVPGLRMPAFERWWIDSKCEERRQVTAIRQTGPAPDPVIPCEPSVASPASQRLIKEVLETREMELRLAEGVVKDLCRQAMDATKELASLSSFSSSNPLRKRDRIELEQPSSHSAYISLRYLRPGWESPYEVRFNRSHYIKLKEMFSRIHPEFSLDSEKGRATRAFHVLVMALLLRYSSMSGGQLLADLRGGGMQGAIHPAVFRVLQSEFRFPQMECFASPLNAYLGNFASAFPDLDWHFGSVGDFMEMSLTEGCFEANPPFSPGLMTEMVERIDYNIETANKRSKSLTFVVVVPTGSESGTGMAVAKGFAGTSFRRMTGSQTCRMHVVLPSREHGYVEGAQHLRPTRYKESSYDTSVILLQSKMAQMETLDEKKVEQELRKAFASRHKAELDQRRSV